MTEKTVKFDERAAVKFIEEKEEFFASHKNGKELREIAQRYFRNARRLHLAQEKLEKE